MKVDEMNAARKLFREQIDRFLWLQLYLPNSSLVLWGVRGIRATS